MFLSGTTAQKHMSETPAPPIDYGEKPDNKHKRK